MSASHKRDIDPVTGYDTTGHEWNGIIELNTPLPKLVIWALVLTFLYSLVAWVLLPAWPVGRSHTPGLLGLSQEAEAVAGYDRIAAARQGWVARFDTDDPAALLADAALMATARPAAARLFADNCAACHGAAGQGGPGFPVLSDHYWLWGGTPSAIATTITHGINSDDPDSQIAMMPSFDTLSYTDREALARHVAAMHGGAADADSPGAKLFAENCVDCHGEHGEGGLDNGAPALNDAAVIYGQDFDTVMQTLLHGRAGTMPAWSPRLSRAEINLLALHVAGLSAPAPGKAP